MDRLLRCAAFAAVLSSLAACGGGGSTTTETPPPAAGDGNGTPQTVTGIQTPSSVSVVTAKNAQ
jgi:hypothetical protein